jgi:hypothetical protein
LCQASHDECSRSSAGCPPWITNYEKQMPCSSSLWFRKSSTKLVFGFSTFFHTFQCYISQCRNSVLFRLLIMYLCKLHFVVLSSVL